MLDGEEKAALALEEKGDLEWAAVAYDGTAPLARALDPACAIPRRREALLTQEELRRQVKEEDERARTEKDTLARFGRALVQIRDGPIFEVYFDRMLDDLGLARLVKTARTTPGSKEGQMAARLLTSLAVEARSLGGSAMDAGDGPRAALFFETAMRASELDARMENSLRVWLACAKSRAGDGKRALTRAP